MKDATPIAVASRSFSKHPELREELLSRYSNVRFNDDGSTLAGGTLIEFLRGRAKVVVGLESLTDDIFSALPALRVVSKYGVGLDSIDLASMQRRGLLLGWTGGVNRRSVAELVLASMINLLHKVPLAQIELASGQWRQVRGRELSGKTVGIVGCGHVGKEVAIMLRALGCRILSFDISDFPGFYAKYEVERVDLEGLLRQSDVVTLHLPFNKATSLILDADRLEMMKPGAYLINAARGGLFDERKVKEMLLNGRLGGAAFDVFMTEPPVDTQLLRLPNVIATPHIGGSTEEAILAMGRAAIEGLDAAAEVDKIVPQYLLAA